MKRRIAAWMLALSLTAASAFAPCALAEEIVTPETATVAAEEVLPTDTTVRESVTAQAEPAPAAPAEQLEPQAAEAIAALEQSAAQAAEEPTPQPTADAASAPAQEDEVQEDLICAEGKLYQEGDFVLEEQDEEIPLDGYAISGDVAGATNAILEGLRSFSTRIDLARFHIDYRQVIDLYMQIVNDNPNLFYCRSSVMSSSNGFIFPRYNEYASAECIQIYEETVNEILTRCIRPGMTDFQKALALHEDMVMQVRYDTSLSRFSSYDALVGKVAVCQGYALAYRDLLNRVGVRSAYAESEAMNHIWNTICLDGVWYNVDVTWDDPLSDALGRVMHNYFMKSDGYFVTADVGDHYDWTTPYACTGTAYDGGSYWGNLRNAVFECGNTGIYLENDSNYTSVKTKLLARDLTSGAVTKLAELTSKTGEHNYLNGASYGLSFIDGTYYFADAGHIYRYRANGKSDVVYAHNLNTSCMVGLVVSDYGTAEISTVNYGSGVITRTEVPLNLTWDPIAQPSKQDKNNTGKFVDRLYRVCLGRKADAAGKASWVDQLTSYRISGTTAAYGFVFSKEFKNKNYSNGDYVEHLYKAFMDRKSDAPGKADWVKQLESGKSREEVFYGFANSTEFDKICNSYGIVSKDIETYVTRMYAVCLGRKPDGPGLADWAQKLRSKASTGRDVAYGFVFSPEFINKSYNSADYVEHLYAAFMGRGSDPAGKAGWVNGLIKGKTGRDTVFDGFVGSNEFSEICAGYQIERG